VPMFDIGLGFDDEGNGYENIYIRGLIMGLTREQIAAKMPEIAEFSELGGYLDLPVRTYSAGMSLRLMFAIATSLEGDIILMDEWLAVGDAEFRHKANARLRKLTEGAGILVLASHDMSLLRETCTLGMHIEAGKVRNFGKIGDVIADSERPAG
jgi:ABC-2 type transport system ATP-binding protein